MSRVRGVTTTLAGRLLILWAYLMDVYTTDDDENLVSYISESNIETKERLNLGIYKDLVAGGKVSN